MQTDPPSRLVGVTRGSPASQEQRRASSGAHFRSRSRWHALTPAGVMGWPLSKKPLAMHLLRPDRRSMHYLY